ncbi:hypothetical protein [Edaphobacter sp. HDX4]|uniref:hypothetical protein n=1 Tax=Edaphobacter sp. HDX4 TaxID=2794064 RepID=UPI002FE67BAB
MTSCRVRLRPILMTSLATLIGLLPPQCRSYRGRRSRHQPHSRASHHSASRIGFDTGRPTGKHSRRARRRAFGVAPRS